MNPLISQASSLYLPLNQLSPHCTRLLNSLHDGRANQKESILFEQTLWNEVKKVRALNDTSIFLYLVGYYHTILYQIAKLKAPNDLFQYHVLIRIGDLNRYMLRNDVAEYYYCTARNLFPYFGHAYNQLGLLTKPTNCYKCCYYYARAARSTEKPLTSIADSNLRIAVSKYNCSILSHILNGETHIDLAEDGGLKNVSDSPETVLKWFYVIVVAIYADNIQPITKAFLRFMNDNFSTQKATTVRDSVKTTKIYCDRESYILLASLDILFDWMRLGSQRRAICPAVSTELRQIRSCLQSILSSCRDHCGINAISLLSATDTNLSTVSSECVNSDTAFQSSSTALSPGSALCKPNALPHDYVMKGFSPLDSVHRELVFKAGFQPRGTLDDSIDGCCEGRKFVDAAQLEQLVNRLRAKMEGLAPLIRKQTRNIALESIISNMNRDCGS